MTLGAQHWKLFDYLNLVTGWNRTPDDYMEAGRRIYTLRQLFNIRHGIDPRKITLPPRPAGKPPLGEGPLAGRSVPVEELKAVHWDALGWDRDTGAYLKETIRTLGIDAFCPGVFS